MRLGKALDADWAIYGEIKNIDSYEKSSFFGQKRASGLTVRLSVVDCRTEEIVYWRTLAATHSASKGLGGEKMDKMNRMAMEVALRHLSDPFFKALPEHTTLPKHKTGDNEILGFIKRTWPSGN